MDICKPSTAALQVVRLVASTTNAPGPRRDFSCAAADVSMLERKGASKVESRQHRSHPRISRPRIYRNLILVADGRKLMDIWSLAWVVLAVVVGMYCGVRVLVK